MATTAREPNTPYTALVRHVVDDGSRTRRALILILAVTVAGSVVIGAIVVALMLTGAAGTAMVGGGTLGGIASGWVSGRIRARRRATS